jgi:hypothetical protein
MKAKVLILIFGFLFFSAGFPQMALVLKDIINGREWAIRKGKRLVLTNPDYVNNDEHYIASGSLVSFTDSSLTLRTELTNNYETILFEDIGQVRVKESSEGRTTGSFFLVTGALTIVYSPFTGIEQHAPYDWTNAIETFGFGVVTAAIGYLILAPYEKSYTVSGICHSRNERYLRNRNNTYYFSTGFGFGPSYGGIGFRTQARLGNITGVGFHLGGGWNFFYQSDDPSKVALDDAFNVLGGVKFFPYRGWYLDAQFGQFGKIATVSYDDGFMVIHHIDSPYGFVFTLGGDWFFGRNFGLNLGLGTALDLTAPESSNTFSVFDMGFIIKF